MIASAIMINSPIGTMIMIMLVIMTV